MDDILRGLLTELERHSGRYDLDLVAKAYEYAKKAHGNQRRKCGEPYITHPVEVVKILLYFRCDINTVIASLFHDLIEDTEITYKDIEKDFGGEIAMLVEGVTKLGQQKSQSKEEQQIETFRKMLLAMVKDIRVILIKLADRIHNLRTLEALPDSKQLAKAHESIEFYAPLAHRLGIHIFKTEIEDIAVRILDPVGYKEILDDLAVVDKRTDFYNETKKIIEKVLKDANIKARVEGRVKSIYSIYQKIIMQNKRIDEVYDLYAYRIIIDTDDKKAGECYTALGLVNDCFKAIPGRLKDYIATPKPNNYKSIHTIVNHQNQFFEIQIKTEEMHRVADMGIAAHWKYKGQVIPDDSMDTRLAWVAKLLEVQSELSDKDDFAKTFKIDLYGDQRFITTPKGDTIQLPADSNIIDFAYAIHSEVGNKMIGGRVNGKMSELSTKLFSGDVVEIITSQSSPGPSRDWLNIARTNEAKSKIRSWFKKEKREENIKHGKETLESEMRRTRIYLMNLNREEFFLPIMKRYNISDLDEFYAAIGYGGITISKILPKLREDYLKLLKHDEEIKTVELKTKKSSVNGVFVDNIDNCLIRLAGCCSPLPGDEIIGFITRGAGVSIHKSDCGNVLNAEDSRLVRVRWDKTISEFFETTVCVTANSRIDLLADISATLASIRTVTHSINTRVLGDGYTHVFLTIEVHDNSHLESIIEKIKRISGVVNAERTHVKGKRI